MLPIHCYRIGIIGIEMGYYADTQYVQNYPQTYNLYKMDQIENI